jgi:hypothetical protein
VIVCPPTHRRGNTSQCHGSSRPLSVKLWWTNSVVYSILNNLESNFRRSKYSSEHRYREKKWSRRDLDRRTERSLEKHKTSEKRYAHQALNSSLQALQAEIAFVIRLRFRLNQRVSVNTSGLPSFPLGHASDKSSISTATEDDQGDDMKCDPCKLDSASDTRDKPWAENGFGQKKKKGTRHPTTPRERGPSTGCRSPQDIYMGLWVVCYDRWVCQTLLVWCG